MTYLRLKSKWKAPELSGIFVRINISFSVFRKHSIGPQYSQVNQRTTVKIFLKFYDATGSVSLLMVTFDLLIAIQAMGKLTVSL